MDPNMMASQVVGPAPFFYYNPDPNSDNRQHGHFIQHPAVQQQMQMYPVVPTLPSTPIYSRPSSSCSQPPVPTKVFSSVPSNLTPMASPQMTTRRPAIFVQNQKLMLETDIYDNDSLYYPATPPLSSSGSNVGSPDSGDILATPLNPMFSGLEGCENVKPDVDAVPENLEGLDWSSCGSPPMTPVYLAGPTSCPSVISSTSPYAPSIGSEQDAEFCCPQDLSFCGSAITIAPAAFEEFRGESAPKPILELTTFEFHPELHHGLPTFDDISDIESEEDFLNGIVDLAEQPTSDLKRSRSATCSTTLSSFLGDGEIEFGDTTSVVATGVDSSEASSDSPPAKKAKKDSSRPIMNATATATEGDNASQEPTVKEETTESKSVGNSASASSDANTPAPTSSLPAPPNRRGRKQSLTEDPSKTFICELCNRRFKRQEHLKRHYRSLHTEDKPFECGDCGKTFSRSDNLAQHARVHGAIPLNMYDDSEGHGMMMGHDEDENHQGGYDPTYGQVLFQITSEVPGSASDYSSDDTGDALGKKRKRTA